jgi:hypothetical protein
MSVQTHSHSHSPARIVAVCGAHTQIHPLVLQSLCARAARAEQLALVVGDNHFDAYRLARLARAQGLEPASVLSRLALTRAFTCYQLHHSVATLDTTRAWNALYVLGLLEMFYDQDVREREARRLLLATLCELKRIAANGLPVLVTLSPPKQPGRETFVGYVHQNADVWWQPSPLVITHQTTQQIELACKPDCCHSTS